MKYIQAYNSTIDTAALRLLTTTNRACFQGLVLIRNLAAQPHKDSSDYKAGWVGMCCFGDFVGGELVIPVLNMKFEFQPVDIVFFRSALVEHYVLPFVGVRTSFVLFSYNDVIGAFD